MRIRIIKKIIGDHLGKFVLRATCGKRAAPPELVDLLRYFACYGQINFTFERHDDGSISAYSTDFHQGSIITEGKNEDDLDDNIRDAILTAFELPSAYASEARVKRVDQAAMQYVVAG